MEVKNITQRERVVVAYVIGLLKTDAYFIRYFELLYDLGNDQQHVKQAFVSLEDELHWLCGEGRYKDYNTFREMRRRYAIRSSRAPKTGK